MQTIQIISVPQLHELIDAVYSQGAPIVKEANSEYDSPPVAFPSSPSLQEHIERISDRRVFSQYSIYYPEAKGFVEEERVELNPTSCKGHTYRISQKGWGLIYLQITLLDPSNIECRVVVNTSTRARNWSGTYTDLKSPELWDWKIVNRHAGRLVRLLRKLGKNKETPNRGVPADRDPRERGSRMLNSNRCV